MQLTSRVIAVVLAALAAGLPSGADCLERAARRLPESDVLGDWNRSGCTTSIAYYNICSGYVWVWSDFEPEARVGIWHKRWEGLFPNCDAQIPGTVYLTCLHFWSGAPSGYGYTGTVELTEADSQGCPVGSPIASQSFLPTTGWNRHDWDILVPGTFAVVYTFGPGEDSPVELTTEDGVSLNHLGHPACGSCFPVDRTAHSLYLGTLDQPECPGLPFLSGGCTVETLHAVAGWAVIDGSDMPVEVEGESWGKIKAMYR